MGQSVHRIHAYEVRKQAHPIFPEISKYWLTVAAKDFPKGISTAANARDPVGMNRRIYRDVKDSLAGVSSLLGTFDLLNKGITILAVDIKLINKEKGLWDLTIDDDFGGIVDGAHTAEIIREANENGACPAEQHVEVYIRTNITGGLVTDIARGLNTSLQVAPKSIYNIDHVFDWLKALVNEEGLGELFSWKESDTAEYDVRDLVGLLEIFNVFDYPNDSGRHPISAYEKWSAVLDRFAQDYQENKKDITKSKYYRLRSLLLGGLRLWDTVRSDFMSVHNNAGGSAGKLKIVEEAAVRRGDFTFPFAELPPNKYRLTKGAAFPIIAAFRNYVEIDEKSGDAVWRGGFGKVLKEWSKAGSVLVAETASATKEIGRNPDMLGKNRGHWDTLHTKIRLRVQNEELLLMRRQLERQKS